MATATALAIAPAADDSRLVVNLPFFPGFYGSWYSCELYNQEEQFAEYEAEKEADSTCHPDAWWPEALRLDAREHCEAISWDSQYGGAYRTIAAWFVTAFDRWAQDNLGTPAESFTFESMDSPREYNFTTDRIYAHVPLAVMQKLLDGLDQAKLAECVADRFTSYDGFISGYPNAIDEWELGDLAALDHNELATVLGAALASLESFDRNAFDSAMFESTFGDEGGYMAFEEAVNWPKYEGRVLTARAEKLARIIEESPPEAAELVAMSPKVAALLSEALSELDAVSRGEWESAFSLHAVSHYHCPDTPDLFWEPGA
jgi:hypothetical protein